MSTPNSKGLQRTGVEKVESAINGTPFSCARLAMVSRSQISRAGLDTVSQKKARVLLRMFGVRMKVKVSSYEPCIMYNCH